MSFQKFETKLPPGADFDEMATLFNGLAAWCTWANSHGLSRCLRIAGAIRATYSRRRTDLPREVPTGLSPDFTEDAGKQAQWRAFLRKSGLSDGPGTLGEIAEVLRAFLMPPTDCLRLDESFDYRWPPGGPWIPMS